MRASHASAARVPSLPSSARTVPAPQLPDSIDTPVRWEAAELEQLQYQPAIDEVSGGLGGGGGGPPEAQASSCPCGIGGPPVGGAWGAAARHCSHAQAVCMRQGGVAARQRAMLTTLCTLPTPAARALPQIRQQQASWRQQYDKFAAALQPGAGPCSWEDFLWAVENVRSRAFSGPYTGSSGGAPGAACGRGGRAGELSRGHRGDM